ncbi:hypothetical protein NQZ68_010331 [Dissostichus eleginoides]|nr:hypothetical protein NQZ68_010331 [Dissostichus eleginoides]
MERQFVTQLACIPGLHQTEVEHRGDIRSLSEPTTVLEHIIRCFVKSHDSDVILSKIMCWGLLARARPGLEYQLGMIQGGKTNPHTLRL